MMRGARSTALASLTPPAPLTALPGVGAPEVNAFLEPPIRIWSDDVDGRETSIGGMDVGMLTGMSTVGRTGRDAAPEGGIELSVEWRGASGACGVRTNVTVVGWTSAVDLTLPRPGRVIATTAAMTAP